MAAKAETLDVVVASTVEKDMAIMIEDEKALREAVYKLVCFLKLNDKAVEFERNLLKKAIHLHALFLQPV